MIGKNCLLSPGMLFDARITHPFISWVFVLAGLFAFLLPCLLVKSNAEAMAEHPLFMCCCVQYPLATWLLRQKLRLSHNIQVCNIVWFSGSLQYWFWLSAARLDVSLQCNIGTELAESILPLKCVAGCITVILELFRNEEYMFGKYLGIGKLSFNSTPLFPITLLFISPTWAT